MGRIERSVLLTNYKGKKIRRAEARAKKRGTKAKEQKIATSPLTKTWGNLGFAEVLKGLMKLPLKFKCILIMDGTKAKEQNIATSPFPSGGSCSDTSEAKDYSTYDSKVIDPNMPAELAELYELKHLYEERERVKGAQKNISKVYKDSGFLEIDSEDDSSDEDVPVVKLPLRTEAFIHVKDIDYYLPDFGDDRIHCEMVQACA